MVTVGELGYLQAIATIDRYKDFFTELEAGFFDGEGWYVSLLHWNRPPIRVDDMDSFGAALVALAERLQDAQP